SSVPTPATGAMIFRDYCMEHVKAHYPYIEPRNDWELVQMTMKPIEGSRCTTPLYTRSTLNRSRTSALRSAIGWVPGSWTQNLNPQGCVPPLNVTPHISHPSPSNVGEAASEGAHTQYSLCLFPGSLTAGEYCMDIVDSVSGEPVNSPFEFELWGALDPATPAVGTPRLTHKVPSMERRHGLKREEILPGHEKWLLTDGRTYGEAKRPIHRP
ncbi:hypothetical protein GY45DRAFT_1262876, partial [Cubamyces sp. BRFM 1775]